MTSSISVIRTSATFRMRDFRSNTLVPLMRGYALDLSSIDASTPWNAASAVGLARIIAVNDSLSTPTVFIADSALALNRIPSWIANPDVRYISTSRKKNTPLRAVTWQGGTVSAVSARPSRNQLTTGKHIIIDGITCEDLITTAVRMALCEHPLVASVAVSMILNRLSKFNAFHQAESRKREETARHQMLKMLEALMPIRGGGRALSIIKAADGGCTNVAEAALLWLVSGAYCGAVVTQMPIQVRGQTYFADIAFPDRKIIFEFDGRGKLGETTHDFHRAQREWMQRQRNLEEAGWRVVRFNWEDFEDFTILRHKILKTLSSSTHLLPAERRCLWVPPSIRSDGRNRRFHVANQSHTGDRYV